jgi:hypothetical protein
MASRVDSYAGKAAVKRAIDWAREFKIDVAGFELRPDGTIRVLDQRAFPAQPADEFEAWEQAGKL